MQGERGERLMQIDIFPWNQNFDTGIAELDDQHQQLVGILNRLAAQFMARADIDALALEAVFDELSAYSIYHFEAEEAIWQQYLADEASEYTIGPAIKPLSHNWIGYGQPCQKNRQMKLPRKP
ncbi:hypothetical protein LH51_10850 [Nitrincola sp. A-D6]|uniref:bacteriohemerythrin n=1 Tax=Nitrincola sp. A-D6 TaxID=1545442 RepID=UPI00051F9E22|nr:hemerythrin domain-containing protein [Nitrincola sp. A-D6]KGK41951.1 hypothetical protein LH51_10850 [Nitrincola sp. A-D6]